MFVGIPFFNQTVRFDKEGYNWKWELLIDSSEKNKDRNGASMKKLGRLYYIGLFFNGFVSVPLIFWTIVYIIVEVVTGMQRLLEAKRILND